MRRIVQSLTCGLSAIALMAPALMPASAAETQAPPGPDEYDDGGGDAAELTPDQQAMVDSWPAEKQASYETWPDTVRVYYWSLTPERQDMFWGLTDEDKVTLSSMPAPDQDAAWQRMETRASAPPAPPR